MSQLAVRPDVGKRGREIAVLANFFEIGFTRNGIVVHQYHVEIMHPGNRKLDRYVCNEHLDIKRIRLAKRAAQFSGERSRSRLSCSRTASASRMTAVTSCTPSNR